MKEAEVWEKIEKEKARNRQLSELKNQDVVTNHVGEREKARKRQEATQFGKTVVQQVASPEETNKTRDIVAEKVGLGSGETYRRAKVATNKIDEGKL